MAFDRYKILEQHYRKEIQQWDWQALKDGTFENVSVEYDNVVGTQWLGSITAIYPSGKYYMPWTTNQTRHDIIRDECFHAALENEAEQWGLHLTEEGGDIYVAVLIDDLSQVKGWVDASFEQEAIELLSE